MIPGKNRTLFELRGLNVYTEYCVRVMAYNRRGDGLASDPVCAYTDTDGKSSGHLNRFQFHVAFNNSGEGCLGESIGHWRTCSILVR